MERWGPSRDWVWKGNGQPGSQILGGKVRQQSHQHTRGGLGIDDDDAYDKKLEAVLVYLDAHLELETEANSEDMWDYQDKDEDWDGNDQYWG